MHAAGIPVEYSKGEAWPGQHEINFRYADAVTMADNHTIYKNGAKEIAHLNGCSLTFMAKPREDVDRELVPRPLEPLARRRERVRGRVGRLQELPRRPDRAPARARGLRRADRSTRTSASRPDRGRRRRSPGATTTGRAASGSSGAAPACGRRRGSPVRTRTRTSASRPCSPPGSHGIENELELPPPLEGNAYESDAPRFPHSLSARRSTALEGGSVARAGVRRRRRRPLPELRADGAAALRLGRDRLRAAPHVRARLARGSGRAGERSAQNRHEIRDRHARRFPGTVEGGWRVAHSPPRVGTCARGLDPERERRVAAHGDDVKSAPMGDGTKPVVGITTYAEPAAWGAWNVPTALVPLTYVEAVEHAGGRPLLVPPTEDGVEETLDVARRDHLLGRLRPRPGELRRRPPSGDERHRAPSATARSSRSWGPRSSATSPSSRSAAASRS